MGYKIYSNMKYYLANERVMMMMMMNGFCDMVDWRKMFTLISAGTIARDPHHRQSPTRGDQDNIANGKYWRSSLVRKLLNVKHYAPYKSNYLKCQIIKFLENCFQNLNCVSSIKLTPIWIHLKYWHYTFPHL